MQIHVTRGEQRFGPYTEAEVSAYLASGQLNPTDLGWHEGAAGWVPLAQLLAPAAAPAAAVPYPTPPPAPFPPAGGPGPVAAGLQLYNPNAAASWSLLFSPAFGAFLHARNWRQLGDPGRARANMVWFFAFFVYLALIMFLPLPTSATNGLGVGVLLAWYFSLGKKQIEHVKAAFPNGYPKRSLLLPLLSATAALFLFFVVVFAVVFSSSLAAANNPDALARELTEEVQPSILAEWRKNPKLVNPKIEHISLAPVNGSGTSFAGDVDASFGGKKESLKLEVTFDPKTKNMSWKTLDK